MQISVRIRWCFFWKGKWTSGDSGTFSFDNGIFYIVPPHAPKSTEKEYDISIPGSLFSLHFSTCLLDGSLESLFLCQLEKIRGGFPCFFLPFRSVELFQSELQWEHGDNLGVSHTCLFLGLDMPIKQLMTFRFQTHQKTFCYIWYSSKTPIDRLSKSSVVLRIVSNFHMMSRPQNG